MIKMIHKPEKVRLSEQLEAQFQQHIADGGEVTRARPAGKPPKFVINPRKEQITSNKKPTSNGGLSAGTASTVSKTTS